MDDGEGKPLGRIASLAEAELSYRYVEECVQAEQVDHLVARLPVVRGGDAVNVLQQIEGFDDGEVPPELRSLSENDADPCDVLRALTPGRQAQDFAATRIGYEDF